MDFEIGVKARDRFRLHSHRGDNWTVGGDKNAKEESIEKERKEKRRKEPGIKPWRTLCLGGKESQRGQAGGREQVAPESGEGQEGQPQRGAVDGQSEMLQKRVVCSEIQLMCLISKSVINQKRIVGKEYNEEKTGGKV